MLPLGFSERPGIESLEDSADLSRQPVGVSEPSSKKHWPKKTAEFSMRKPGGFELLIDSNCGE